VIRKSPILSPDSIIELLSIGVEEVLAHATEITKKSTTENNTASFFVIITFQGAKTATMSAGMLLLIDRFA
jgi:hypothetical protein